MTESGLSQILAHSQLHNVCAAWARWVCSRASVNWVIVEWITCVPNIDLEISAIQYSKLGLPTNASLSSIHTWVQSCTEFPLIISTWKRALCVCVSVTEKYIQSFLHNLLVPINNTLCYLLRRYVKRTNNWVNQRDPGTSSRLHKLDALYAWPCMHVLSNFLQPHKLWQQNGANKVALSKVCSCTTHTTVSIGIGNRKSNLCLMTRI